MLNNADNMTGTEFNLAKKKQKKQQHEIKKKEIRSKLCNPCFGDINNQTYITNI